MIAHRTRGELVALAIAAATVIGVIALVVVGRGWWQGAGGSYAPARPLIRADVSPPRSLFGQVLTARARVVVDPHKIDAANVKLAAKFGAYRVRDSSQRIAHDIGRAVVVEFTYRLQCTERACLPRGGGRLAAAEVVQLPAARLTLPARDGTRITRKLVWPAVAVQSRLTSDEIGLSTPKPADPSRPAAVTWRIEPNVLAGASLAAALLLVLGAGWLLAAAARQNMRFVRTPRIPSHLGPVERALILAEHAAAHGEVDESRKALERLATELRRRAAERHAEDAERLAWSEEGPSRATVSELAEAVRSNGAR